MSDNSIKVGFCVAYDWRLLAHALPQIYAHADVICLSVDENRLSWTQKPFEWDQPAFNELIRSIDVARKILLYEDNFHVPGLSAAENEVRQRRMMAEKMGEGGWHIQLDCDEYFLNFNEFVRLLGDLSARHYDFNVCCQLITIFKEVEHGFLYVAPDKRKQFEFLQIASRTPKYERGRRNGYFNLLSPFLIVHQSWARSEKDILQKLSNWGHVHDFDGKSYFEFWKGVTVDNFPAVNNFHPLQADSWPSLKFIESSTVDDLIVHFQKTPFPTLGAFSRLVRNSIFVSRVKNGLRLLYKRISGMETPR